MPDLTRAPPGDLRVVTIGDSLTQGGAPPHLTPAKYQYFMKRLLDASGLQPRIRVDNYGIGGEVAHQIVSRIPRAIRSDTDVFVLMGGTNDAWRFSGWDAELAAEMQDDVVETLARGIDLARVAQTDRPLHVVLCTIPPVHVVPDTPRYMRESIVAINQRLRVLARDRGVAVCDVHAAMSRGDGQANPACFVADGVHFTVQGNQACGEAVGRAILRQYLDVKNFQVVTIGASNTEGDRPHGLHPRTFQYWLHEVLKLGGLQHALEIQNHGVGGEQAYQILQRIPAAVTAGTDVVVLLSGTNDCWRFADLDLPRVALEEMMPDIVDEVAGLLEQSLAVILARETATPLLVIPCTLFPVARQNTLPPLMRPAIVAVNERLRALAAEKARELEPGTAAPAVVLCDVFAALSDEEGWAEPQYVLRDGVHLTVKGYHRLGSEIGKVVLQHLVRK